MFVLKLILNVQLMVRVCNILSTRPEDSNSSMFILLQDC